MNKPITEVFRYPDTNAARASIEYLNRKFENLKIAIIGMGGTGSYILDLVSKTPVKEIHIYDSDTFQLHNAFRAPGAISGEKFDEDGILKKVQYYASTYSNMHTGIIPHDYNVTINNESELAEMDFVFISVDKNAARSVIVEGLLLLGVPFIDCGLGVNKVNDSLLGTLRVTTATSLKKDHLGSRIGAMEFDENEYAPNIQIADLNCLNATLAVIKWKKIIGFYQDLKHEHNSLYLINTGKVINEDFAT
jgi:hypothetical protein